MRFDRVGDDTCHEYDNSNHTKGECGRISQSFIVDELNEGSCGDGGVSCLLFIVYCLLFIVIVIVTHL